MEHNVERYKTMKWYQLGVLCYSMLLGSFFWQCCFSVTSKKTWKSWLPLLKDKNLFRFVNMKHLKFFHLHPLGFCTSSYICWNDFPCLPWFVQQRSSYVFIKSVWLHIISSRMPSLKSCWNIFPSLSDWTHHIAW